MFKQIYVYPTEIEALFEESSEIVPFSESESHIEISPDSVLNDMKTRITTSTRIIQPQLVSRESSRVTPEYSVDITDSANSTKAVISDEDGNEVKIEARRNKRFDDAVRNISTTNENLSSISVNASRDELATFLGQVAWPESRGDILVGDSYSQVSVPVPGRYVAFTISQSLGLIDAVQNNKTDVKTLVSEHYQDTLESSIFSFGTPESIFNKEYVDWESEGVATVSGHILNSIDYLHRNAFKKMVFHLPQGYRQRAKWYMHKSTLDHLMANHEHFKEELYENSPFQFNDQGEAVTLYGKPIVIVDSMQNLGDRFPVIFGDLSRGYIIGKQPDFEVRISMVRGKLVAIAKYKAGGQIIQPAAIKYMKHEDLGIEPVEQMHK